MASEMTMEETGVNRKITDSLFLPFENTFAQLAFPPDVARLVPNTTYFMSIRHDFYVL